MDRRQFLRRGAVAAVAPLVARIPAPAFAQGAPFPAPVLPNVTPLPRNWVIDIGYRKAVRGFEHVYPTLAEAVAGWDGRTARSTKIEWLRKNRRGKLFVEHNFQQIIRTPFGFTNTEQAVAHYGRDEQLAKIRKEQLHEHLAAVETTLKDGKRTQVHLSKGGCVMTCAGVSQFKAGRLELRPLRDLILLTNRQAPDYDGIQEEFLGEFSLQVS